MNPVRAILAIAIVGIAGWGGYAPRAQGGNAGDSTGQVEPVSNRPRALAQGPGGGNNQGPRGEGRRGPREGGPGGESGRGPGGPGGPEGGPPPPGELMNPETVDEIISIARDYDPELGNRLEDIRSKQPARLGGIIKEHMPNLGRLLWLKRNNPDLYKMRIEDFKLNRESESIAKQIREAGNDRPKTDKLKQQLRAKITEQFTQRQKIRERELLELEKKIEDLRREIRSRKEKQAELIAERENELIEKPSKAEW